MTQKKIASITIGFLIIAFIYSMIPPETIAYTEIDYGVKIDSPEPNTMNPFTVTAYLFNNQSKTVYVEPFSYNWDYSIQGIVSTLELQVISTNDVLKIRPNETFILREMTINPKTNGTYLLYIFNDWIPFNVELPPNILKNSLDNSDN